MGEDHQHGTGSGNLRGRGNKNENGNGNGIGRGRENGMETDVAINNLQQFVDRYPNSTLIDSCNNIIDGLRFKLETKSFESVRLYSKTEKYMAAVSSALTFMEDYPMSGFKEEVHYLLVMNSYYLAKNSVENKKKERIEQTIERYSTFVAAFPDSKFVRLLAGYDDEMRKELREY